MARRKKSERKKVKEKSEKKIAQKKERNKRNQETQETQETKEKKHKRKKKERRNMWDEVEMPDRACRLASLVRYARAKYPWMNADETGETGESVLSVVDATPEYSMRGYYTFGEKEERAALGAVLRARHAVIETVMMCLARQQTSATLHGQMTLASELRSIPSQIMAIVAAAAMRL
jgi:hypothetical protein